KQAEGKEGIEGAKDKARASLLSRKGGWVWGVLEVAVHKKGAGGQSRESPQRRCGVCCDTRERGLGHHKGQDAEQTRAPALFPAGGWDSPHGAGAASWHRRIWGEQHAEWGAPGGLQHWGDFSLTHPSVARGQPTATGAPRVGFCPPGLLQELAQPRPAAKWGGCQGAHPSLPSCGLRSPLPFQPLFPPPAGTAGAGGGGTFGRTFGRVRRVPSPLHLPAAPDQGAGGETLADGTPPVGFHPRGGRRGAGGGGGGGGGQRQWVAVLAAAAPVPPRPVPPRRGRRAAGTGQAEAAAPMEAAAAPVPGGGPGPLLLCLALASGLALFSCVGADANVTEGLPCEGCAGNVTQLRRRGHFSRCPEEYRHYCVKGRCRFLVAEAAPACVCEPGYMGARCELVDIFPLRGDRGQIVVISLIAGI
uniref:Probetacellulin n=1 Tax=Anas platyrhynchos platyrhynchos TaxID=8840 RepID=A0A493TNG4_ANAPP